MAKVELHLCDNAADFKKKGNGFCSKSLPIEFLGQENDVSSLNVPNIIDQGIWRRIDRIKRGASRILDIPAEHLEEEAQIVVKQAVFDKKSRVSRQMV